MASPTYSPGPRLPSPPPRRLAYPRTMRDDADTLVDAKIRKEALAPRTDHRRTVLLVMIVAAPAAISAAATTIYVLRPTPEARVPTRIQPVEILAPVAPVPPAP